MSQPRPHRRLTLLRPGVHLGDRSAVPPVDVSLTALGETRARIVTLRRELAAAEQQEREALVNTIRSVVPPGVLFSSAELFEHATVSLALVAAFDAMNITSARQLGKKLRTLRGCGLTRVGVDERGVIWMVR